MVGRFQSAINMSVTVTLSALYFAAVQLSVVIVTRRETAPPIDVMCDASVAVPVCLKDGMFFSVTPA